MKRYALLCMMMMVSAVALAIPAKPGLTRKIQLSDGTSITARLTGDEHGHYWLGDDGKAYTLNDDIAQQIDVEAVKTRALARRNQANAHRAKRLNPQKVGEIGNYIGQKKGIIILVNFSNVSFESENNNALYQRIANEANFSSGNFKGSMYDYFYAQSDGKFQLTFDVVGPFTISNTQSYYGSNDSQGNDKHPAEMVIEALKKADSSVNFADYDWDGDGEVDQVYVIYAGKGEADGGASTTIWPHEWQLSSAAYYGDGTGAQTLDGVKIDTYACGGELNGQSGSIAGIGTMCHEFSHCLGYPDFYDTDYSGGQGMGYWDLMDSGSYNDDGYRPAGYTSYERWVAGWRTPVELSTTTQVSNMPALASTDAASYIIYNKGNNNEYFLLENRQKQGWDADIPGAGLLILHVDYSASSWNNNTPNDDPSHQRMTWIAADNQYQYTTYQGTKYYTFDGMANDPFPYGRVNAFNSTTTPAAKFFNKNSNNTYYLDSSVENITQNSDGTVSFKFQAESNVATPTFSPKAGRYAEAQSVTISCETANATIYYTLDGSAPTTNSSVYSTPLTISETTIVKAMAVVDGEESAVASAKYTIGASTSNPETTTFRLVESVDDLEAGMRYIIACGSKATAASGLTNSYLEKKNVTLSDDIITISDGVAVFVLEGDQTAGWSFQNETTDTYLYATTTKKLAYSESEEVWTLSNGTNGVVMTYGEYGTMLYNVSSPRFTTYTSAPTTSMIQANLYIEDSSSTPITPDPTIVADESLSFQTTVGKSQTKTLNVLTEGLTDDVTLTLSYLNKVCALDTTTIPRTQEEATVSVTFTPTTAGNFTGTITLSSAGAESVIVTLSATATDPAEPSSDKYVLVTDASTLAAGDEVLIAYVNDDIHLALGTTQNNNNRAASEVTLNADGTITPGDDTQVISLEKDGSNFLFNVGTGYLHAASSSKNYLKTETTADDNAKATISISSNSATIIFQGSNTRNTIAYNPNNGTPIFSCYATIPTGGSLPQLYRKTTSGGDNPGDDPINESTAENPYSVEDVMTMFDNNAVPVDSVYVKGIVASVTEVSTQYHNATYYISDDGETDGNMLQAYHGRYLNNTDFTDADQIQEGDTVIVYGLLQLYHQTIRELSSGNYLISLSRPGSGTPDPIVDSNCYALVTDASTLAADDEVLIAYVNEDDDIHLALGTTQNSNNRTASVVTLNTDGTITPGEDTQVITLEKDGDNFLFNVGNGYLYAANSDKNYLRTEETPDENGNAKASITIAGDSATIVFQGVYTHNTLRYNPNNGSPIFSCYLSTSATGHRPQIYRKVPVSIVAGDVNRDGQTSIADVTALVNIILGKDNVEPYLYDHDAADVNHDDSISIADVTSLVNIILGKGH